MGKSIYLCMKCPNCNKKARQAIFDFHTYVCNCLGYVEDVKIIKKSLIKEKRRTGTIKEISSSINVMSEISNDNEIIYFDNEKYKLLNLNKGLLVEFDEYEIFAQEDINKKYPIKAAKNIKILF